MEPEDVPDLPPDLPEDARITPPDAGTEPADEAQPTEEPVAPAVEPPPGETPPTPAQGDDGGWRVGAHLVVLVGLVPGIPLNVAGLLAALLFGHFVERRHPAVRAHVREAFNFQINVAIVLAVAQLLIMTAIGCCLGAPIYMTTWLANVILIFIGAWYAGDGERYRYPCFWRPLDPEA